MSQVNLKKYNNDWFLPGSKIRIILWTLISALFFRTSLPVPSAIKVAILKLFGAQIGDGVVIKPSVNIKYPWKLKLGDHTWVGENVWIDNLAVVNIGDNCCLSQGCYLLTGNHDFTSSTFDLMISEINIENEAWVGAKSVVCPGVTLQRASILAVGSIATKNLEELGIYQGNPAIKIKERVIS
ncbi:colanic acid biosynthesis acetyltransferase WcaF [Vibrio breoganii]|uniref:WcaF family extracellular polysaccharide biosynthesis acetyltransferase n=1 Tax=Vibrio breoganii TaxID=553239 RepID=UPI000C84EF19|nr:WcaF family extracellular polysaccharide biosynthesis acetyltransferase [Vibrio breoganii]PMG36166.1 colanic acid biosynthesis acetyltransferase WcaF [Vibrio breoganii]PMG74950.1 colanic acid biosynthesis acetyltransferase WcaF [Vibrio breoganii]PMM49061.1 colanic acid biosynthesis acetyltransferase WcaF [Vibrio breoganii]